MDDKIDKTNTGLSKSSKRKKLVADVLTDMDAMPFSTVNINKDIRRVARIFSWGRGGGGFQNLLVNLPIFI